MKTRTERGRRSASTTGGHYHYNYYHHSLHPYHFHQQHVRGCPWGSCVSSHWSRGTEQPPGIPASDWSKLIMVASDWSTLIILSSDWSIILTSAGRNVPPPPVQAARHVPQASFGSSPGKLTLTFHTSCHCCHAPGPSPESEHQETENPFPAPPSSQPGLAALQVCGL